MSTSLPEPIFIHQSLKKILYNDFHITKNRFLECAFLFFYRTSTCCFRFGECFTILRYKILVAKRTRGFVEG